MIKELENGRIIKTKCQNCKRFCSIKEFNNSYIKICEICEYVARVDKDGDVIDVWDENNALEIG